MRQLTLRVDDALVESLKTVAAERGESLNAYAEAVLTAAVDPELADSETARLRERLARAGLLDTPRSRPRARPARERVAKARASAGKDSGLANLVSEDRR